jgi:hypothetical protein
MRYEHPTATVTFKSQIIQDFFGILAILDPFLVLVEVGGDHLTTAQASYGNHYFLFL